MNPERSGSSPDQSPEAWGEIAQEYELAFERVSGQYSEQTLDALGISAGERVLDVAAGAGALSLLAARRGATVLATDFAPGMIARHELQDPEAYWTAFTRSAPPLAYLFGRLSPEQVAAVGRAYVAALRAQAKDGAPVLEAEACLGIGIA
ncbi:MAG: hypothetical protein U0527_14400 [Candidatus Eisenbacteria bacterium]